MQRNTVGKENEDISDFYEDNEDILHDAMVNAYLLIIGELTYEELIDSGNELWLPSGFDEELSIDSVIQYFEKTEDYEKCGDMLKVKKAIKSSGKKDALKDIYKRIEWGN
jgi:hypothetical protein